MTKKDFELIARVLRNIHDYTPPNIFMDIVDEFAAAPGKENEKFNRAKFVDACYRKLGK